LEFPGLVEVGHDATADVALRVQQHSTGE